MLVLTILKIIGILLLVLLGLLFSAALLVLVVPLRYRIWMEYRESLKAKVSVSWLLKMAELKAVYDGELDVDVRALWFHPLRDGGKKEPAETEEKKQKQLSNVSVSASVSDISENFPLQEYIPFL